MCIIWCLLAHKYYDTITHNKKSEISTYKKHFDEIIQPKDITYPIDIQRDIPKFEKLNNIKINVLEYIGSLDKEYDKRKLVSAYNTRSRNENVINLLLLKDGDKEHLVWIKEYGKFQGMGYNHCKMYWCSQCLSEAYDSQEKLNEHLKLCMNYEAVRAILPEKNKVNFIGDREDILKFKNNGNTFKHPFHILKAH